MVKLMPVNQAVRIAACAGIVVEPVDNVEDENLYFYATEGENHIVYVGKNEAEKRRSREYVETHLSKAEYKRRTESGFASLIQENNAKRHSFRFDPEAFDPSVLDERIKAEEWSGGAFDSINRELATGTFTLSVADVEAILIRIHVCTGRLIGNSQHASQWEHSAERRHHAIAVLAADVARQAGILPEDVVVAEVEDAGKASEESVVPA